jgi:hypothetical protein
MEVTTPKPRRSKISLTDATHYHSVCRCVRRSFLCGGKLGNLCGEDSVAGKNYEYRRQWAVDKLLELRQVFAIDVCAYAVINHHSHVVLHVNSEHAKNWSVVEVLAKPMQKMLVPDTFIRRHPWRSPFGPAKAVLFCSR